MFKKAKEIESSGNRIIKLASSLMLKKYRLKEGRFIAEGINPVVEALRANIALKLLLDLEKIEYIERDESLIKALAKKKIELLSMESKLFRSICSTDHPQGIAAICKLPEYRYTPENIIDINPSSGMIPLLENVSDPGNCGTIIRLATGMGLKEIGIIGETADPYSPKVVRASSGIVVQTKVYQTKETAPLLGRLKELGYTILVTDSLGKASLKNFEFPEKAALVFGGEARGVSPMSNELSDGSIHIPVSKDVESYNVAIAAAIFLYEYHSQKT